MMKNNYRIYRTERYGNYTHAATAFPLSLTAADCTLEQAENLADALSTYSDAGCDSQYLVECPECGHCDATECVLTDGQTKHVGRDEK